MLGVVLGAIGFPVIYALIRNLRRRRGSKRRARFSLHVKLTLITTGILLVLGAIAFSVLEADNASTIGGRGPFHLVFQALFMSVMTRSGGFSTFDTGDLSGASLLVTDMLMFIGGGSASTAGGIKVTTIAILFIAAFAEARGNASMEAFERKIPGDVLRLAVSVVLWGATTVALSSIILLQLTGDTSRPHPVRHDLRIRHRRTEHGLHGIARRPRQVRAHRHHVHGPDWYSHTRRRAGGESATAAVHPRRREADRWLSGSPTTHQSS